MTEDTSLNKDLQEIDKIVQKLESGDYTEKELESYYKYIQVKKNDIDVSKRVYKNKLEELLKGKEDDEDIMTIKQILDDDSIPTAKKEIKLKGIMEEIQQAVKDGLESVKELRKSLSEGEEE